MLPAARPENAGDEFGKTFKDKFPAVLEIFGNEGIFSGGTDRAERNEAQDEGRKDDVLPGEKKMNEMGFRENMLQNRDQVRKFFGGLFVDLGRGMDGGSYLLFDHAYKPFFSLPLYRSRKIRAVCRAEPASPKSINARVVSGSQCHFLMSHWLIK